MTSDFEAFRGRGCTEVAQQQIERRSVLQRVRAACLLSLLCAPAFAADVSEATVTIKGHKFFPAELKVPAGRKVKLTVVNLDPTLEEFESYELNREKVVAGNSRITVFVGPLAPGTYPYFGEFHATTAKGVLIAD